MIELSGQKAIRERIKESEIQDDMVWRSTALKFAQEQFQSDLRALKEELIETQKTITAAIVVYDHYRSGQPIRYAEGKTEKAKFLWTFDALRNPLFIGLDSLISAIDSALEHKGEGSE